MNIKRIVLFIFIIISLNASAQQTTAPITVSGTFSGSKNTPAALPVSAKINIDKEVAQITSLLKTRNFQPAIDRINTILRSGHVEHSYRLNILLAQAYTGQKKWHDVIEIANQSIAVSPGDARPYILRANAYIQLKDYKSAKIDADKALRLNPESASAKELQQKLDRILPAATKKEAEDQQKQAAQEKQKQKLRLVFIYLIVFLLVFSAFAYVKYALTNPSSGGSTALGRGKKIDIKEQFNFIRQIGEGGMGKVYEAYDNVLKRRVAIKRIKPELVRSNYVRTQFLSEARLVALLRHPNIVEIYTVIETDNSLYLVFEYVDGQTLETRLDIDGYIPFSEVKTIFESVCKALHYAHSQDIIHCDLKPGNIMICDSPDKPTKVMDFGVAKQVAEGDAGARTVAGTPAYMSPEQQKGFIQKTSDIFSLGVCMYEALVGQVPWSVAGFDIANKKIVAPHKLVQNIPEEVEYLLDRALEEDPKKRIQSIDEFWSILSKIEPMKNEGPKQKHI
ncbi:Serine/threonine protein kinase [Parelusimicrobium proximum]|uniref:protein kinase domain-containing protein n=1 Tax=Parelusimicrobium proximum TaxID=3228953 RepID=UPI003D1819BE